MSRSRVFFATRAKLEIAAVADWWAANRPAAPDAVALEVERAIDLLSEQPRAGTKATRTRLRGIRRLYLSRIRYYLFYRETPDSRVEVLSLWHTSRGTGPGL